MAHKQKEKIILEWLIKNKEKAGEEAYKAYLEVLREEAREIFEEKKKGRPKAEEYDDEDIISNFWMNLFDDYGLCSFLLNECLVLPCFTGANYAKLAIILKEVGFFRQDKKGCFLHGIKPIYYFFERYLCINDFHGMPITYTEFQKQIDLCGIEANFPLNEKEIMREEVKNAIQLIDDWNMNIERAFTEFLE